MKRAANLILIFTPALLLAQTGSESVFNFTSPETSKTGKKVTVLNPDIWGVYLGNSTHEDSAKLVVDESGIYFLNASMQKSVVMYDPADANCRLYQDGGKYWLFRKATPADKLFTFYEIALTHRTGSPNYGHISPVVIPVSKLNDFLTDCKSDGLKLKTKGNIIFLDSLNEHATYYYRPSAGKFSLSQDPAFDIVIESLSCSTGKDQKWLDSAQYETMKLDAAMKDQRSNQVDGFLVIDKTGIFTYADGAKNEPHYIYKRDSPDYAFHKIPNAYLTLQKLPSGNYDMVVITMKGTKAQLFELKRESHAFYSLTKNAVVNGVVTYYVCNELEKYLLYGKAGKGDYTGTKYHW